MIDSRKKDDAQWGGVEWNSEINPAQPNRTVEATIQLIQSSSFTSHSQLNQQKFHGYTSPNFLSPPPPHLPLYPFSFTFAVIRFFEIRSDDSPMIPFDQFGSTHKGRLELNVSKISLSNPSPRDLSRVSFFLCTRDSWMHVLEQIEDAEITCALQSDLIKQVYGFQSLTGGNKSFEMAYTQTDAHQYTLVLANCLPQLKVSMNVRSAMYNLDSMCNSSDYSSAGKTILPRDRLVVFETIFAGLREKGSDDCDSPSVLFPIIWSIRILPEAANTDGKEAVNLMKLTTLFRRELATLAFYVFTGYRFKPEAHNPYFTIDDEEEEATAEQMKLEDEFEL
ncbi:unnamed protein product [Ilex paraguariensis]|uniref:CAND6/7 N-terminal domain-containing protein n=1 Tax=Ilex paraguariensis TaxID=185542 RepID=A0ABC8TDI8_9AQUA